MQNGPENRVPLRPWDRHRQGAAEACSQRCCVRRQRHLSSGAPPSPVFPSNRMAIFESTIRWIPFRLHARARCFWFEAAAMVCGSQPGFRSSATTSSHSSTPNSTNSSRKHDSFEGWSRGLRVAQLPSRIRFTPRLFQPSASAPAEYLRGGRGLTGEIRDSTARQDWMMRGASRPTTDRRPACVYLWRR